MILTFVVPVILFAFLLLTKKKLVRKHWLILLSFGFIFTFLVSFVSVWSAWNPYALSDSLHDGNYSGAWAVSYPLWMSVYVTPARQRIVQGWDVLGNVSFDVFIANGKVLEANGTISYAAVFGNAHVRYQLESPFSDGFSFFGFLLLLFTMFNMAGFALGLILCYAVSRTLASRVRFQAQTRLSPTACLACVQSAIFKTAC
jgi:hypothetical protein